MDEVRENIAKYSSRVLLAERPHEEITEAFDGNIKAVSETITEVSEISRNVEDLTNGAASLESYVDAFLTRVSPQDWNRRTARQFNQGLQAILLPAGIDVTRYGNFPSFEAVGVTDTGEENREENEKEAKGIIQRLKEAVKKAVETLAEGFYKLISHFRSVANTMRSSSENLVNSLLDITGNPKKDVFEGEQPWAKYLYLGEHEKSPAEAVKEAVARSESLISEWTDAYKEAIDVVLRAKIRDVDSLKFTKRRKLDAFGAGTDMPGGKAISVNIGVGKSDLLVMTTSTVEVKSYNISTPHDVKVMTRDDIRDVARALKDGAATMDNITKRIETVTKSVKEASNALNRKDDKETIRAVGRLLPKIALMVKEVSPIVGETSQKAYLHAVRSYRLYE